MQHPSSHPIRLSALRRLGLILLAAAIALAGVPAPPVSADTLVVLNTNDADAGSLRQRIADSSAGDTIVFDADLSGETISLASTLVLPHDLTIDASALALPIILDGQQSTRALEVAAEATVALRGLTITRGIHIQEAGGILNRGNLTVSKCTVAWNRTPGASGISAMGGAIANYGSLTVSHSAFMNNSAGTLSLFGSYVGLGGAIYSSPTASLTVISSGFSQNGAIGSGGAVHSLGTLEVDASPFAQNGAIDGSGGAIHHAGTHPATVHDCTFDGNTSGQVSGVGGDGGAIHNEGPLTVSASTFSENLADYGAGIANREAGTLHVSASTFLSNTVTALGGGIMAAGAMVAEDCEFSGNAADGYGGAVAVDVAAPDVDPIEVTRCTFTGNSAQMGGGLANMAGPLEVRGSAFAANTADMAGGLATMGTATVRETAFISNTATMNGGAVATGAQLTVTNATFSENTSGGYGGALLGSSASVLTMTHSTLVDNVATSGGGALATEALAYLANSIVRSTPGPGSACVTAGGGAITATHNLVSDTTCGSASTEDPLLDILMDNGGPTPTYALLEGSPAVNAGDPTWCATVDQRGVARPQGTGCDIGAYEATAPGVRTDPAEAVTASAATLRGAVLPCGWEATAAFEVGETTAYGTTVSASPSPLTGTTEVAVSSALTGLAPHTTYHYRAVAENGVGLAHGEDRTFATAAIPPGATTLPAVGVTPGGATVRGTVNAHNDDATVTFEYGLTDDYGATAPASPSLASGAEDTAVSAALTGLLPNTLYHYRVVAANGAGTTRGQDLTFTTARAAPLAVTDPASDVTTDGATLHGRVTAQNEATAVTFRHGLSTAYGTTISAAPPAVAGVSETEVSVTVGGLLPSTTYHYQVVAANGTGTTVGEDRTFTTLPVPPTATTRAATAVTATGAILHGTVNARNAATGVRFEYGPRDGSTVSVPAAPATVAGLGDTAVLLAVSGLEPSTEYVYRVVAENAGGQVAGADMTFVTGAAGHVMALPLVQR